MAGFTTPLPATSAIGMTVIPGGPAGEHSASGISKEDRLIGVSLACVDAQGELLTTDLTGEFVIPDDTNNVIRNPGGNNTTSGTLIVVYLRDGKRIFRNIAEARAARA